MSVSLVYFKMRALAEAPQMLMRSVGMSYDYQMSWEYYDNSWVDIKSTLPFKQLPVLIIDGTHVISQSIAILKYIEYKSDLTLEDPVEKAKSDAILQSAQELFAPLNPTINFAVGKDFFDKKSSMMPTLVSRFEDLERALVTGGRKFFIDDTARAAEFATFHHLDLSKKLDSELITKFPRLEEFLKDLTDIPEIKGYLETRPELIGVAEKPQLIIAGKAHPTGVQKT